MLPPPCEGCCHHIDVISPHFCQFSDTGTCQILHFNHMEEAWWVLPLPMNPTLLLMLCFFYKIDSQLTWSFSIQAVGVEARSIMQWSLLASTLLPSQPIGLCEIAVSHCQHKLAKDALLFCNGLWGSTQEIRNKRNLSTSSRWTW